MKTIEISDEMYEALMTISKGLNTQDHRGTAMPYFFQIREKKRVSCQEDYHDGFLLICGDDHDEVNCESVDSLIKALKEDYEEIYEKHEEQISDILNTWEDKEMMSGYIINDIVSEIEDEGFFKWYYQDIETYKNAFLTEEACKQHIKLNHYHYTEPVDYLSYAFRNTELETVMKFISEMSGGKIHK